MRKQIIIVIILGILSITNLLGQVFEPDALQFNHFTTLGATTKSLSTFNNSDNRFKYEDFVFGWHWGGERIISKVMKVNQSDMTNSNTNDADPFFLC